MIANVIHFRRWKDEKFLAVLLATIGLQSLIPQLVSNQRNIRTPRSHGAQTLVSNAAASAFVSYHSNFCIL